MSHAWITIPLEIRSRQFDMASSDDVTKRAVEVSLAELAELCSELVDEEVVLVLSIAEVRRLMLLGFLEGKTPSQLQRIAMSLGVRITAKDCRRGTQQILYRLVGELEKPSVQEKMFRRYLTLYLSDTEIRDKIIAGPGEDAANVAMQMLQLRLDILEPLGMPQVVIQQRHSDNIMLLASLLSDEVFEQWAHWIRTTWDIGEPMILVSLWHKLEVWLRYHQKRGKNSGNPSKNSTADEAVREELAALKANYEADMREMWAVMERQKEQLLARVRGEPESSAGKFEGQRILVVGDESHAVAYRALVEEQGATFDFLPGYDQNGQIASKMTSADGIVFVTAYASHLKFYALKAHVDMRRAVMVNRAGLAAFGMGLEELGRKLDVAGEV